MKKNETLVWSLIAALCLMVAIAGVILLRSYNSNKTNQTAFVELGVTLNSVTEELEQTKALASEKEQELETQTAAFQQQLDELQQALNNTLDDRNTLSAQLETMHAAAAQAEENAELQQSRYSAAFTALGIQKNQIQTLKDQIDALKQSESETGSRSVAEQKALQEALEKAQAELAALQKENEKLAQSVSDLSGQAAADKTAAAAQMEELNNQIAALQQELNTAKAAATKDAEQSAAQVADLSAQLTKAQTALDAASKKTENLDQTIAALNEQLDAAKAAALKDAAQSAAQVVDLNGQLTKARDDLAAASEKKESLDQMIASLNEQLANAKAAVEKNTTQSAEQVASLNSQLAKALKELEAARKEKEDQDKAVADLTELLANAKAAAVKDTEQATAQLTALNDQLTKAQAALDNARKEKENLDQSIATLNEQLTAAKAAAGKDAEQAAVQVTALNEQLAKAQADLDAAVKDKEALNNTIATLNQQLTAAKAAAGKDAEQAAVQVTALNEQLAKAQADLDAAAKDREALNQSVASLNEQLSKSQQALEDARGKAKTLDTISSSLKAQLKRTQDNFSAATAEKKALDQTVASLKEQLDSLKAAMEENAEKAAAQAANLDAAVKDNEALTAAQTALQEELDKAKSTAAATEKALAGQLKTAQDELDQTLKILADTTYAMDKAGEEAAATAAALEQKVQALSDELTAVRGSLAAETQKTAQLQEDLDVQSAQPAAVLNRLQTVLSGDDPQREENLRSLAGLILRGFGDSVPAAAEGEAAHSVPVSVLMEGQEIMTVIYEMTQAQEAEAREIMKNTNESQALYQLDLNHEQTAAVIINGTVYDKQAYETVYAEVFAQNPGADEGTLKRLTVEAMVRRQVIREHAASLGIDPDAQDMESQLWSTALKNVAVSEKDFSAALETQQQAEDQILASDPAEYARMLEAGQIASPRLPEGSRFVKQLIIPLDMSSNDEMQQQLNEYQKRYDEIFPIINGISEKKLSKDDLSKLEEEGETLAKLISQMRSDIKLFESFSRREKKEAENIALQLEQDPDAFEALAAASQRDEEMPASGYAVFQGAVVPDKEWIDAALALEKEGDASEPLLMADGYHVLYYSEQITQASPGIQAAQEALRQELLAELLKTTKDSLLTQWVSSAEVQSYVD